MFEESQRQDDHAETSKADDGGVRAGEDGGIPLDAFWARIDPVDA